MPVRRACSVLVACALAAAGLAACSGPSLVCACPARAKPAYALDVTMAGRVRWQVPLAVGSGSLSPLAVGAVAVFAQSNVVAQDGVLSQGDVLYGLRLADGYRLWSRHTSQPIAGMWRWQNLVVVLTQSSAQQQQVLTGLDASTGHARWTLRLGRGADGFSPTADGGLAIAVDRGNGVLEVVDLSSGRVRWRRPVGSDAVPPVAVGGTVLVAVGPEGNANSQLTSYDDRTGRVRWAEVLKPSVQPPLQASAGLIYLQAELPSGAQPTYTSGSLELLGISAADGRLKWRLPGQPQSWHVYAPGLVSVGTSLNELDPVTGRVRWHVVSSYPPYQAIATPAGVIVIVPGPNGTDQISVRDTRTGRTRWTARLNQPLLVGGPAQFPQALPVARAGHLLVAPAASPDGSEMLAAFRVTDGHRVWQVTIPGRVDAPPSAVPGGMLVCAGG